MKIKPTGKGFDPHKQRTGLAVIVVDLDGTLCNTSHREALLEQGDWDAFNAACNDDKPYYQMVDLINMLSKDGYIIIASTGRNEEHRLATFEWLRTNFIDIDHLLMRPNGNYQKDADLKIKMVIDFLGGLPKARKKIVMVIDDKDTVIDAWRGLGFMSLQVGTPIYKVEG